MLKLALAALALTVPNAASGPLQPAWAEPFQAAVSQLRQGETVGAMQSFDLLWRSNPNDAQLATYIGASLDATSHHREATPWYQRALTIQSDFEPALNDLALNYASLGEFSKARPLLQQLLQLHPLNAHASYNLGLVALQLHDYREAARAFERARESGDSSVAPDQLARAEATARFHLREYTQAAALLGKVHGNGDYKYLLLLGSAQALSGDLPSSIKTLQQAVSSKSDDPQAYYRLALVFMLGRLDGAAQNVLAAGLKQIPNSALLLFGQAVQSDALGKLDDAVAAVKQSLQINSQQTQAWALLGRLYAERGQTDQALGAYERAVNLGAGAEVGVDRAQLLIRLQRFSEAEAELSRLAKRYPDSASVHRGFGKLYREERKFDLAEKHIRHAIRLDPENAESHFSLAEVLRLTHRMEEAKTELAIFKEKKPAPEIKRLLDLADSPG